MGPRQPANLRTETAPTAPNQGYYLLCSHLRIMTSAVLMAHSPSKCLIFDLTNPTSIFFQAPRAHIVQHQWSFLAIGHSGRHTQEGCRGMCYDPFDNGGEVRACSVGCTLGMTDISPLACFLKGLSA